MNYIESLIDLLLENRGINSEKQREEFFEPTKPQKLNIEEVGIKKTEIDKALKRIKTAIEKKEQIVIFGDYDTDGICATAILWGCLHPYTDNIFPYIPDRFEEGYGISPKSIENLRKKYPKVSLIITVDNGIVANNAVEYANTNKIDVIITDHHQLGNKLPQALAIVHTDKTSGSGISWFLTQQIISNLASHNSQLITNNSLELAAIGTIADQLPLTGINRSIAKYGLQELNKTTRPGLLAMYGEAGIKPKPLTGEYVVGTYEINYLIAPRINAMGRLTHGIDSLRLLCTTDSKRAQELARLLGKTNYERQQIVEKVLVHAKSESEKHNWEGAIVLVHETYHEGVIGLAAGKLVEEFYRPAIVLSKGKEVSKASARSISGFNIIEAIRKVDHLLEGGGGHPMAAGFSIKNANLEKFISEFEKVTKPFLTEEVLSKRIKVDAILDFSLISFELSQKLKAFEPTGIGNYSPSFAANDVSVVDARSIGIGGKHLKLKVQKAGKTFDAIAFNMGDRLADIVGGRKIDIVFTVEENEWMGNVSIQLRIKDLKITEKTN